MARDAAEAQEGAVVKLCWAGCAAQRTKREVEEKAREEAKRQKIAEEKKKKKRTLEYLQQLQDEMLEEDTALLESAEGSQVMGSKHKEALSGDDVNHQPSKKAKGKQPVRY